MCKPLITIDLQSALHKVCISFWQLRYKGWLETSDYTCIPLTKTVLHSNNHFLQSCDFHDTFPQAFWAQLPTNGGTGHDIELCFRNLAHKWGLWIFCECVSLLYIFVRQNLTVAFWSIGAMLGNLFLQTSAYFNLSKETLFARIGRLRVQHYFCFTKVILNMHSNASKCLCILLLSQWDSDSENWLIELKEPLNSKTMT